MKIVLKMIIGLGVPFMFMISGDWFDGVSYIIGGLCFFCFIQIDEMFTKK